MCGGGRYDGMIEGLGGKSTPAAGFALGLERLIELVKLGQPDADNHPVVYLVAVSESAEIAGVSVAEQLRDAGISTVCHLGGGSFKRQMRQADRSGAQFAVILGEDELLCDSVTVKPLRVDAEQQTVAQADLGQFVANELKSAHQ